ncbi:MAG: UDP-N-acetyl-D-glucosamine dehydrogenase [Acidobacteria bacterium]|nr:MAG: UDP-N-acetyl-D-glucosamine dehydrogenase [Acidobacteriota bacterium]
MPVKVGVIGVGHLGQHHARLFASMDGVQLIGVCDTNHPRAEEIASKFGTQVVDAADLLSRVNAVTVAVPTIAHLEVAMPFLDAGVATLIEKPIAPSVEDADRLVAAAERGGALLATGHTERFNPAVAKALPLIADPRFIEIHRLGTFPERSLDIDVIFDLMIHDLDLLLSVVKSPVTMIEAVGVNVLTPKADIANARLRFASGCIANVTASRISRERVRKARFFQHDSYVSIDYASQELEMFRLVKDSATDGLMAAGRPIIHGGKLEVMNEEPLRRELEDFVDAVRAGRAPGVTGRDGREALALATRVAETMES